MRDGCLGIGSQRTQSSHFRTSLSQSPGFRDETLPRFSLDRLRSSSKGVSFIDTSNGLFVFPLPPPLTQTGPGVSESSKGS